MDKNDIIESLLICIVLTTSLAIISIVTCYVLDYIKFSNTMFNILLIVSIITTSKKIFKK